MPRDASDAAQRRPTWIVGVDGSENARHAALWATAHAEGRAGEIRLLAVRHDPTTAFYPGAIALSLNDREMQRATEERVNTLAEGLRSTTSVLITTAVATGGAARVLLDAATDDGLTIVGSRGRGGFSRLILGSTSSQVATHSSGPTAVIPLETDVGRARRLLVAVDGSDNSLAALDWAVEFAQLDVEHPPAVECVMVANRSLATSTGSDETSDEAETSTTLEQLVASRFAARRLTADVDTRTIAGDARRELVRAAQDVDLLVTGARGRGAVGATLLGSVSTWLLHHATKPMVIVPAPA